MEPTAQRASGSPGSQFGEQDRGLEAWPGRESILFEEQGARWLEWAKVEVSAGPGTGHSEESGFVVRAVVAGGRWPPAFLSCGVEKGRDGRVR